MQVLEITFFLLRLFTPLTAQPDCYVCDIFLMGEGIVASMHTTTHIGCLTENLFQLFKLKQFPASWQGNTECILSESRV